MIAEISGGLHSLPPAEIRVAVAGALNLVGNLFNLFRNFVGDVP